MAWNEELAANIRAALEAKGYDLVLRQLAPRTDVGKRNAEERSMELAAELIRRGA